MASYPPPYGYDVRAQRRLEKDRWRAQREAMKMQARLRRDQIRGLRRRSLLGPLLLVGIGLVAVLVRNGRVPFDTFWQEYSRWWPLVFVFAGLVLLAEWGLDQWTAHGQLEPTYVGRRGIGAGVVFVLVLLAALGASATSVSSGMREALESMGLARTSWDTEGLAQLLGEKHESEQTLDGRVGAGGSVRIENPHGDVTVSGGSEDGQVHITAHKEVYSRSEHDAERLEGVISPRISMVGGTMSIVVERADGATSDLTVTMPERAALSVTANHGDLRVSGLKAAVDVTAHHGDITISDVDGEVTARMDRNDASFSVQGVRGSVGLKGHAQDLSVEDISGAVSLDGEFYGTSHLEKVTGAVRFHTSRTDLQMVRLGGEVEVSPDASLSVDKAAGPLLLTTRNRNITLDGVAGDVSVTNSNGTVDVVSSAPVGDVTVANRQGNVTVTMPDRVGFSVDAETREGDVENEFGLPSGAGGRTASLSGTVGRGGPKVKVTTTHGDVSLRKAEVGSVPVVPPVSPEPPIAPVAPVAPVAPRGLGKATRL